MIELFLVALIFFFILFLSVKSDKEDPPVFDEDIKKAIEELGKPLPPKPKPKPKPEPPKEAPKDELYWLGGHYSNGTYNPPDAVSGVYVTIAKADRSYYIGSTGNIDNCFTYTYLGSGELIKSRYFHLDTQERRQNFVNEVVYETSSRDQAYVVEEQILTELDVAEDLMGLNKRNDAATGKVNPYDVLRYKVSDDEVELIINKINMVKASTNQTTTII